MGRARVSQSISPTCFDGAGRSGPAIAADELLSFCGAAEGVASERPWR
jgi:hypothetical protein